MAKQTFTTGQVLTAAQMTSLQQTAMGGGSPSTKTASYVLVAADAGTVIQMNAAGSTTITVNTALFAAGDTVFIQNIGAGTCTVTAGTATVTTAGSLALTQWEGGTLYFTSTSASIFFDYIQAGVSIPLTTKGDLFGFDTANARVPIGSNGTVLTADSTQALGLKWAAPASGSTFVGCSLYKSGTQTISNATRTALSFDTEEYDTDAFHDNTTNNSRITIPSGKAGKYLFTATVGMAAGANEREMTLFKNGTILKIMSQVYASTGGGFYQNASCVLNLSVGDYVQLYFYQGSGGNLSVYGGSDQTLFQASYLGA